MSESGKLETEMEVADWFDGGIDVEDEGGHHADFIADDRPITLDVPIGFHVVDGVDAIAEVQVVHENLELVDNQKEELEGSGGSHESGVHSTTENRVIERHEVEDDARKSNSEGPNNDQPVETIILGACY